MKKQFIFYVLLTTCIFYLSSFVGYDTGEDTPGTIEFIGDAGSPNKFVFRKWQFTKVELPNDNFEQISIALEINTSSLQTASKDLESNIRNKKDYFYVKKFPTATVTIDGAKKQEDGSYKTNAMLSLKDKTKPVELHFTVSDKKPYVVKGSGVIIRQQFSFKGKGPKDEVPVNFEVTLP